MIGLIVTLICLAGFIVCVVLGAGKLEDMNNPRK